MTDIEKYEKLSGILTKGLVGKEDVIKSGLLTILTKGNMILVGPPGTAKSEIARRLTSVIKNGICFEYLLTKFTTPEEIFGPLSLSELKNDKFVRNTEGYLPTSNIGFLDEIFKANSSILNSLLTIINERTYHNGNTKQKTNIVSIIGASNELPTNEKELIALYDRFLMKKVVDYVSDSDFDKLFDVTDLSYEIKESYKFTLNDIDRINEEAMKIPIGDEAKIKIKKLKTELKRAFIDDEVEQISDRKYIQFLKMARVSAYLNGRSEVTKDDLAILKDCFWSRKENIYKIYNIFDKIIRKN